MRIEDVPFGVTDWAGVPTNRAPRARPATALVATRRRSGTSACGWSSTRPATWPTTGARAATCCWCCDGELVTELQDGSSHVLRPGQSYQVADDAMPHRSRTAGGATPLHRRLNAERAGQKNVTIAAHAQRLRAPIRR